MKKSMKFLCALALVFAILPFVHVHDEACGYDEEKGTPCIYEKAPRQDKDLGN